MIFGDTEGRAARLHKWLKWVMSSLNKGFQTAGVQAGEIVRDSGGGWASEFKPI